ncbi:manganese efflux pump MntP family protein [Usitatibacter palustris]|uniref:Putative manganese efflux pump MntP n=1 Tax=Usitatibacter palustris TaxID=2732487 RepID=A0A6M4H5M9_9PROT|nr:manganese efflux pump MntP family protein [Usitatibacter palustris]QJR14926.1 putative manganese efflux pump MntP [Usitatibacter palustris]
MDAVAVCISSGMTRGARASWRDAFVMAFVFGVFQAAMPVLGYAGGAIFGDAIEAWDHWVAFGILAAVGGHMIYEAFDKNDLAPRNPFAWRSMMLLGVATSLDAAAVGLTLALIDLPLLASIAVIGAVTFALCVPAVRLGSRLGAAFAHRAELAGGIVLIAIGVKILVEHLSA